MVLLSILALSLSDFGNCAANENPKDKSGRATPAMYAPRAPLAIYSSLLTVSSLINSRDWRSGTPE